MEVEDTAKNGVLLLPCIILNAKRRTGVRQAAAKVRLTCIMQNIERGVYASRRSFIGTLGFPLMPHPPHEISPCDQTCIASALKHNTMHKKSKTESVNLRQESVTKFQIDKTVYIK